MIFDIIFINQFRSRLIVDADAAIIGYWIVKKGNIQGYTMEKTGNKAIKIELYYEIKKKKNYMLYVNQVERLDAYKIKRLPLLETNRQ